MRNACWSERFASQIRCCRGVPAMDQAGRGSKRTMMDFDVGVLLRSAMLSRGTSTFASGK